MSGLSALKGNMWTRLSLRFLPFADSAGPELPLSRLLRLSLFQVSVGMAAALSVGTLNRVMILELGVSATFVALMIGLPLVFAPFRALIGFKSDTHRSALGWRRVPYIWFGTLLQFGGLAFMPFALLVLSGDNNAPVALGKFAAAASFLMIGAGMHTTQTSGLALATDIASESNRARLVALMYTMLLLGTVVSGLVFGELLSTFTPMRLIQVVQGTALATLVFNVIALWKQEQRRPEPSIREEVEESFSERWKILVSTGRTKRFLVAVAIGTAAFAMQDALLEPYGGEILGLSVGSTSMLTAITAAGSLIAFFAAARALTAGYDPCRLAAYGLLCGVLAFLFVLLSAPFGLPVLFRIGALLIGLGMGLFSVGTLTFAMQLNEGGLSGLALGAWGAVQATAYGMAVSVGGVLRDVISESALGGNLGTALATPVTGYSAVYYLEILFLFVSLVVIGPLAKHQASASSSKFHLAQFPT